VEDETEHEQDEGTAEADVHAPATHPEAARLTAAVLDVRAPS
jgi:hypothetical protein